MNDNYLITLSKFKANTFEFELETDGIAMNEADVSFIIESSAMNLMFEANHLDGRKWEVVVPPLPILKKTMYPFKITLATEGYFFEPMNGSVNVVGEGSVKITSAPLATKQEAKRIGESIDSIDPGKMSLAPKNKNKKASVLKEHPLESKEDVGSHLPSEEAVDKILTESKKPRKKTILSSLTESHTPETNEKDAAVTEILKGLKKSKPLFDENEGLMSSLINSGKVKL